MHPWYSFARQFRLLLLGAILIWIFLGHLYVGLLGNAIFVLAIPLTGLLVVRLMRCQNCGVSLFYVRDTGNNQAFRLNKWFDAHVNRRLEPSPICENCDNQNGW